METVVIRQNLLVMLKLLLSELDVDLLVDRKVNIIPFLGILYIIPKKGT